MHLCIARAIDKYFMQIIEVINPLKNFIVTVSIKGSQARTIVDADSATQARLLLAHLYGEKNVVSVSNINLNEQATVAPTPSQVKHERLVRWLTNRITRIENRPRFTQQDVRKAIDRYETNQKRANLEFEKQQNLRRIRNV